MAKLARKKCARVLIVDKTAPLIFPDPAQVAKVFLAADHLVPPEGVVAMET
tara:strand:+ start:161 stop:313 length:153 start_codon:yes stop_codon:yes gene_type:complete